MSGPGRRVPRLTIRTRLAALYATVFLVAGTALLGVTYAHMRQEITVAQVDRTAVNDPEFITPATDPVSEARRLGKIEAYDQALRDQARDQTLNSMTRSLAIVLVGLVVVGFGVGWLVARQSLLPVQRIIRTARRVAAGDLTERIALRGPRDEITELADTFDEMLGRLAAAFDSHRRFVANASHELRTPLAINRTLIEVAVGRPDAPPQVTELGQTLLGVNDRQHRLIDGLLALAESERTVSAPVEVDLGEIVQSTVRTLGREADERAVTLLVEAGQVYVRGDPVLLERLAVNLVQNAIRHNVRGGQAWVSCTSAPHGVQVRVANTGPVVDPDRIEELFEPFLRGPSADRSPEGNGLGLSIVRAVAAAHGGTAIARTREGGGLLVVATLPSREGQPDDWVQFAQRS
jgi:signal transduction histidine kinase